jgi:hypothetical protein
MKSSLISLSLACAVLSTPLSFPEGEQAPFDAGLMTSYPGFTLDLDAQRLVQTEGKDPVWMTEMDKVLQFQPCVSLTKPSIVAQVQAKAQGVSFFDM